MAHLPKMKKKKKKKKALNSTNKAVLVYLNELASILR